MKANYHTHTSRCGHAEGTDEQYVRAAVSQGFDVLGFADHVPWPYKSGFVSHGVRMQLSELDDYLASVRRLKKQYAGKIEILTGFECEYFPEYMNWLAEMKEEKHVDYFIFGNHYETTDEGGMYFGRTKTAAELRRYVDSAVKGVETGMFAYMAHPDVFMRSYKPYDDNCRAAAKELCQLCRAYDLPMEYNIHDRFLFPRTHRVSYPNPEFFETALGEGVRVIIGLDAHEPEELADGTQWAIAVQELKVFGERHIDRIDSIK